MVGLHRFHIVVVTLCVSCLLIAAMYVAYEPPPPQQQQQQQAVATTAPAPARAAITAPIASAPPRVARNPAGGVAVTTTGPGGATAIREDCDDMLVDVPLSPLEMELKRLLAITLAVLREKGLTGWAADGTLLGLVRNGRVATDRDLDFQLHSTYQWCASHLASLKSAFEKHTPLRMFKVVYAKYRGQKIGRYAMVRMPAVHGTFGTGVDFNCVYTDDPDGYTMHVHRGTVERIPPEAFPLRMCLGYGMAVPCPRDAMAVLSMFRPRYDGCMVFPHCTGDPLISTKRCLSPHPPMARARFVETTERLEECGWVSLAKHFKQEPACAELMRIGDAGSECKPAENGARWPTCFLQKYEG